MNMNENEEEKLLLIEELAARLRLTVQSVREKVHAGLIPCIMLNARVWRFHWPTVLAALGGMGGAGAGGA